MKIRFETCFEVRNGKVYIKPNTRVGGVMVNDTVEAGTIAGIQWNEHIGHDIEVRDDHGVKVVTGIY